MGESFIDEARASLPADPMERNHEPSFNYRRKLEAEMESGAKDVDADDGHLETPARRAAHLGKSVTSVPWTRCSRQSHATGGLRLTSPWIMSISRRKKTLLPPASDASFDRSQRKSGTLSYSARFGWAVTWCRP